MKTPVQTITQANAARHTVGSLVRAKATRHIFIAGQSRAGGGLVRLVTIMFLITILGVTEALAIQKTFSVNSGSWATAGNWNPSGVPAAGDDVIFPATVTSVTGVPNGSINSVTIQGTSGTINLQGATSGNTLTVTSAFGLLQGKTLTIGNTNRLNLSFASTCVGTIAGTLTVFSGTTNRQIINFGDLTITSSGLINQNGGSDFILNSGGTLRIGNTNGIVAAGTNSGAIQTEVRTFSAAAHYVYNGTANQNTGTGYPTALTGSLTIDNPNTVTIVSAARTITTGTLNLVQGTFATNNGGNRLSLGNNATINRSDGSITGTLLGTNTYDVNYTGGAKTAGPELQNSGLRNVTVNLNAGATLISSGSAFSVSNNLTVTQGNLVLSATNADYTVNNDLVVGANGTLTHSVNWDTTSRLFRVNGNISIDGNFAYTVRSHVQMGGTNKTIRTGPAPSSLSILTLVHTSGTITANGLVTVDDNFWASFNTTGGTFATSTNTVYAKSSLLNSGGTININGGNLNITGGLQIGTSTQNGAVSFSSGTLNADYINIGDGTRTGTLTQSGGTANIGSLFIFSTAGNAYTCSGSPAINVGGNWTNNRSATAFTPANSTVTFNGTAAQSIGGSFNTAFYNLAFDNSSGEISFGTGHSISNNFSIAAGSKANLGTNNHSAKILTLGGSGASNGSWGGIGSTADNINPVWFADGIGILNIDENACSNLLTMEVNQTNITCYGASDGTISIIANNGNQPYSYSIDSGNTWLPESVFSNLPAAAYTIKVKDSNGCVQIFCN